MKKLLVMALIAIVSCSFVQAQTLDPSYPATVTSGAGVEGGLLFSDGKYILYGNFSHVNGTRMPGVVKFNVDGSVDNTFNVGTGPNGSVMAAALQDDGKIILAGKFTSFNDVNRTFLVRLNADGSVDNSFVPDISIDNNNVAFEVLVQPDGKILAIGPIDKIGEAYYSGALARFNANGSRDVSFTTNARQINDIALQADGKIIIVGSLTKSVARLNSDGSGDATFSPPGTGFNNTAYAVEVSSTGQIFVGGNFTSFNGTSNNYLACLDNTGNLDATWPGNGMADNAINDFHLLPDGKLLVAGGSYGGGAAAAPWRLEADGTLDPSLNVGTGASGVRSITANASEDILITGYFASYNGEARNRVAILEQDGTLKSMSFQPNFEKDAWVMTVKAQGADKFLIGHQGAQVNGTTSTGFERLNADGTTDATFNGNSKPNDFVTAITTDQSGRILIGGIFTSYNGTSTGRIARLSSSGDLDLAFSTNNGTGFDGAPRVFIELSDGKILVGGGFTSVNGTPRKAIARLNADGTLDASFNVANGFGVSAGLNLVLDIAVLSDGKLIVAGEFTSFSGNAVSNLIRLNADGSFDNTFQIGSGVSRSGGGVGSVQDVHLLSNGKILIGGMFNSIDGVANISSSLALLSSNGTLENGYRSDNFFGVDQIEEQPNGKIIVTDRNTGLRRLNDDATIDPSFRSIVGESFIEGIAILGNTMIVGGALSRLDGHLVTGLAKVNLPPEAPTNLALTSTASTSITLTWQDNASDEVDFVVERSLLNNTNYAEIAVVPANTTQYTDAGLTSGSTYYYRITARNANGSSHAVEASLAAGHFNMGNKTVTACEGSLFDSGFDGNYSNNESHTLTIYPGTAGSSVQLVFSSFATDAADQLTIYDGITVHADSLIGVYSGTTSPGTVRAVKGRGALTLVFQSDAAAVSSGWNATISCGIFPAPPGNVELNVPHANEVRISWVDNTNIETGYVVERSETGVDADFNTIATLDANVTGYSDNEVTANVTYYYRVKATGAQNDSEYAPVRGVAFGDGGVWRLKKDFDGIARTDAVGFAVDGKGYVGLGFAGGAQTSNFRSYDPTTDTWSTQVDFFGGSVRSEAAAFVVGSKAYVGTGEWFDPEKDLWEYDPSANTWTQKADFGGTARISAIGFAIGDKGYLGFGTDGAGYTKDFWQFDPVANTWTAIATFPGDARNGAVAFVIGDYAYAGTGYNGTTRLKDFYRYDPLNDEWNPIAEFPGAARRHAVAFAVDGKGYVGTGDSGSDLKDFWSYDPGTDSWQQVVNFGGSARYVATAFALNNKGYVSTGFDGANKKDLWEFTAVDIQAAPIAPSNLGATAISTSEIDLQWTDNSSDETGFVIERSPTNAENFQEVATLPGNSTSYADSGLDPGTTYYYRVKINSAIGFSAYTASAFATTVPLPPVAPSNLTATPGTGLEIELAWTDNANNETQFTIERSADDNANFDVIATLGADVTSYTDMQILSATTYYYRIKSANEGGSSGYSNEASLTTDPSLVNAPGGLTAEAISSSSIRLRWTDNSDNEDFFRFYRATDPAGSFIPIGTANPNTTEYVTTYSLVENTTYYYKMQASAAQGDSKFTDIVSVTTLKSIPAAPTHLTASYDIVSDDIILEWVDASDNEEHFVIERSLDGSSFTPLNTTTGTTYTDVDPGTTFQVFYRVAAENNGGTSAFSNVSHILITGIEPEAGIAGLKTYPNPVVDQVTIEWSSPERGEVHVSFFDLTGRELKAMTFEKVQEDFVRQVDLEGVTQHAILMMKLTIGAKRVIRRVVVREP